MLTSLPNLLTLGRVLLVPVVVACFFVEAPWGRWAACLLFVAAAATDWLDGRIARARGASSAFGRWLDPVADKVLVCAVLVMLVDRGDAPAVAAAAITVRELVVSGLREYMAETGLGLPVTRLAKWKTAVQMTAIALLLLGDAVPAAVALAGGLALWAAAALTLVTGFDYLRVGLRHMLAKDAGGAISRP
jgi:cardiolipin synthase